MSNIKTRKGLAFGALVALGASLIAGAPAHAAGELNVVPSAGSILSTLSTETFVLKTNFAAGLVADPANLRYQVKSASGLTAETNSGAGDNADTLTTTTTGHLIDVSGESVSTNNNMLFIDPTDNAAAASVEVTAYVDTDGNNAFDGTEWNTVKTVTFQKLADVTTHINVNATHAGDTTVSGQIVLDGINASQLDQPLGAVDVTVSRYNGREVPVTFLATDTADAGTLKFDAAVSALADNEIIRVTAEFRGGALGTNTDVRTVARSIDSIVASVVKGPNALGSAVRANAPYQVQAYVSMANDTVTVSDDAVAGVDVVASVTSHPALSSTAYVTINGVAYKTDLDLDAAEIKLVSDAKGLVKLDVVTTGIDAGSFTFKFVAQNRNSSASTTVTAPNYTIIDVADNLNNNYRTVALGGSTSVTYQAVDQWGQAPKDGTFIIVVKGEVGSLNAADVPAVSAPVVGGKATLTVANKSTGSLGAHEVVAVLWENTTVDSVIVPVARAEEFGGFDLWVVTAAEATAAKVTVTGGAEFDYTLNASTFTAQDARLYTLFGYDAVTNENTANSAVTYTAVVTAGDVATQTIPGAPVTISAAGLWIQSGLNYGVGSLTVLADDDGAVSFTVYSHKAGKVDVTVTSGAATKTVTVNKFVADDAAAIAAVTASASLTTGRVVLVQFTVVDQYGNAATTDAHASVEATVTGAGYLIGAGAVSGSKVPVAFTAGSGSVQLVDGADEIGTSTVTATLSFTDTTKASKTAASTYTFGQTDANLNISGKRVTADWVFAAGKTVTITRDGVTIRTFKPTANSADSFSFNLKKSKKAHRITIKVNGVTITDAGYLVKK